MYNYKIAFRNIYRSGLYSVINLIGLAISLTAVIIIALWVENELTFNRWYSKTDNLYVSGVSGNDILLKGSEPLVKVLQTEFPEVKSISHFLNDDATLSTTEDNISAFNESGAFVDETIFSMLDIKLVRGDAQSVFQSAFPIILSEDLAKKIFGNVDPIGKMLKRNNYSEHFEVTSVFKNQPKNSSFQFQWLIPFTVLAKHNANNGWNPENDWYTTWFQCCVELQPNVDIAILNEKLKTIEKERRNGSTREIFLYPVSQLHLYGEFADGIPIAGKRVREIKELSVIAFIILLIACINFVNLSTARSEKRMLEMGVRKTFGAKRKQLIWLLMRESAILVSSSLVLALLIIMLALPSFNRLWNIDLSVHLWDIRHLCGILLIGVVSTILSGVYPAFYLSAFHPNDILKKLKNRSAFGIASIRKGLVIFQFATACVLICVTIAVFLQIRHGQNRPLGFDKECLLRISPINEIASRFPIKEELEKNVLITATATSFDPLLSFGSTGTGFHWQGQQHDMNPTVNRSYVSPRYLETVGLKLLEGRDFYDGNEVDTRSVIINKTLAGMMGDEGAINHELWQGDRENATVYTIVGIFDDYIFGDIYRSMSEPLMLLKGSERPAMNNLFVRFNSASDVGIVLQMLQNTLSQYATEEALTYSFVDDMVNSLFDSQKQESMLIALFSILSIVVSCLGLFGLVTYIAESKTKEIGIRKILGANAKNLVWMLTKEFLTLVSISAIIAFPLAYYWINLWLQDYGYRISIGWEIFVMTMLITIAMTTLTIGWRAWKAVTANPVDSLKVE